ncbi:MAG: formyltransferase family protein [Nibricoccus sp.]
MLTICTDRCYRNIAAGAPINWAVLHGEKMAGVTLHVMVKKVDAGDIIDQQAVPIGPDDTSAIVQTRATKAAVESIGTAIASSESGHCGTSLSKFPGKQLILETHT